jgi:hypothetical protein
MRAAREFQLVTRPSLERVNLNPQFLVLRRVQRSAVYRIPESLQLARRNRIRGANRLCLYLQFRRGRVTSAKRRKAIKIKASKKVAFRASKELKEAV